MRFMRFFNAGGPFDPLPWGICVIVAAIIVLVGVIGWAAVLDQRAWDAFAATHDCRVVQHAEGTTSVGSGISSGGQAVTLVSSTPDRVALRCNDGVTYWGDE